MDLLRFEDGVAVVSLLSSCVMTLQPVQGKEAGPTGNEVDADLCSINAVSAKRVSTAGTPRRRATNTTSVSHRGGISVLLQPGDLLLLTGPSRYEWKHGITRTSACQSWCGAKSLVRDESPLPCGS